jgi:hypothetical protein
MAYHDEEEPSMRQLAPLLLLALSACASLSEDECRTADWRELGVRDGRAGYTAARLAEHREACVKHGVHPDEKRYGEGRKEGLRAYCQLDNAVREGLAGRRYQNVCPTGTDRNFRDLNDAAYAVHQARKEIESIDSRISSLENELRERKTSDRRRLDIRDEIRELDRKRERLRDDLRWRERDLDRLADSLLRGGR